MSSREGLMVQKLKEGLHEAIAFLRMLEQFKIPRVVESRGKVLLEKLLSLQGDSIKVETPPSFDDPSENGDAEPSVTAKSDVKSAESPETKTKSPEPKTKSPARKEVRSPTRQGSLVNQMVSQIEEVDAAVKREKRLSSPPAKASEEEKKLEEEEKEEEAKEEEAKTMLGDGELRVERTGSISSLESEMDKSSKDHKGRSLSVGLGKLFKGKKKKDRDASPAPPDIAAAVVDTPLLEDPYAKIQAYLDHQVEKKKKKKKSAKNIQWVRRVVKVKECGLVLDDETLGLSGCTVGVTDGETCVFEIFSHPQHRQVVLRAASEEERDEWVKVLQEEVLACKSLEPEPITAEEPTPQEAVPDVEVPPIEVPQITIDSLEGSADKEEVPESKESPRKQPKKVKEKDKTSTKKTKNVLPDQGVRMRGYIYRKKWNGWEKCWGVLSSSAFYFTGMESNSDYNHIFYLSAEAQNALKEDRRGHDKAAKSLVIKSGKAKEQVSVEGEEFYDWYSALQEVLGISEVMELLSEDEDADADSPGELYEPIDGPDGGVVPAPPASPRPMRHSEPTESPEPIEEDIYEEFDDVLPSRIEPEPPVIPALPPPRENKHMPTLPPRNEPKAAASPVLPPRNAPISPNIPPKGVPATAKSKFLSKGVPVTEKSKLPQKLRKLPPDPMEYEVATTSPKSARAPKPPPIDTAEELYDDVVHPETEACDELYEDVVAAPDAPEENYDDVVMSPSGGVIEETYDDITGAMQSDENYTAMSPGEGPTEEYVVMEPGEDGDEGELYMEVDPNLPPPHALGQRTLSSVAKKPPIGGTGRNVGTFAKMFGGQTRGTLKDAPSHAGHLGYRPPGNMRFREEWCVLEGPALQFFRNTSDKRFYEKLSVTECDLSLGSKEAGAGKFAFRLAKAGKTYHFSTKGKAELDGWIAALRSVVKSAPPAVGVGDRVILLAIEDHIAESDNELTFKKGTHILLVSKDSTTLWTGQIGDKDRVFSGKKGKFPAAKVDPAEDLYI